MQSVLTILSALRAKQIALSLDDATGNLRLKGNTGSLTTDERELIKANKSAIVRFLQDRLQEKAEGRYEKIEKTHIREAYPLSNAQRRLWILSQFPEASMAYNMPAAYMLNGSLDTAAAEYAFQQLISRHESLRTVFREDDQGEVFQYILPATAVRFKLTVKDMRNSSSPETDTRAHVQADCYTAFDLAAGPLIRASLYQTSDDQWVLACTMHHIISDGWSMGVVLREFLYYYTAFCAKNTEILPELPIQYKDYVAWQLEQLSGEQYRADQQYWMKQLGENLPVLELPSWKIRPAVKTYNGAAVTTVIGTELKDAICNLSDQNGSTLFMTLTAAVTALLFHYTGQEDIVIGTPVAGREHEGLADQVGFYVNTLPLRISFSRQHDFLQLLGQVKEVTLNGYRHQLFPFDDMVYSLSTKPDKSRNPLFDVMILVEHYNPSLAQLQQTGGLQVSKYEGTERKVSKFDLLFNFTEEKNSLVAELQYNTDVCSPDIAASLLLHLKQILAALTNVPSCPLGEINFLNGEEKERIIHGFNDTTSDYQKYKTVVQLFEEQVSRTPDHIALVFENESLTYQDLDDRSSRIGNFLRRLGIKENMLVPVCIERSTELITAILGVLKAGGAYVPVDAEYPAERIRYMVEDSGAKLVLTAGGIRDKITVADDVQVVVLEDCVSQIAAEDTGHVPAARTNDHIVYVIYTSGSTGLPKGVKMPGKALVNLLDWQEKQFVTKVRRVMQFASLNFDVSFQEIFSTFCNGSTLYLISAKRRIDMHEVYSDICTYRLTHLFMPYIVFNNLAEYIHTLPELPHLPEQVIVAGEQLRLTASISKLLLQHGLTLINHYGPTETHICTCYVIDNHSPLPAWPPIGRPLQNLRAYILNKAGFPVPPGVFGELYISGVCLAEGYLNKKELTDAKFIPNPYANGEYARMYRTGDLARWLPDGNIEFLGRTDDQLKVRGFRVEPGEIETVIQQHPAVDAAVVVPVQGKQGALEIAAYIEAREKLTVQDMRNFLGHTLPGYMIPTHFVQLDRLPFNTNGKVNKKMLPDPFTAGLDAGSSYEPPANETEEKLALICKALLGKEKAGRKDSFFDMGGHSLQATQLIARIKKEFGVRISIQTIFNDPTIENISDHILFLRDQEQRMKHSEQLIEIDSI